MSYLQVVGEQHHQVESHMAAFTTRVAELRAKHNLLLPGALEVCRLLSLSFISTCAPSWLQHHVSIDYVHAPDSTHQR